MSTLEERFWSQIWQCRHRRLCRQCCWPYGREADYQSALRCWHGFYRHCTFYDKALGSGIAAHRLAYMFSQGGMLILPGRSFAVCHQCSYASCCNPAHLTLGARADNYRDQRGQRYGADPHTSIFLPDGRRIVRVHPDLVKLSLALDPYLHLDQAAWDPQSAGKDGPHA